MERRRFLSCAAGMALPALSPAAPAAGEWRNRQSGMTYRRLGRTGLMVSSIGMGGDDIRPDNNDQVLWAMDQGLNYFDTAPQYGNGLSEKGYAAVLKARGRDKVFQADKVALFYNSMALYKRIFDSLPEDEQTRIRGRVEEQLKADDVENPNYLGGYFAGQASAVRQMAIADIICQKYADRFDRQKQYKQYIISSVEGSLKALGTDAVDCLLIRGIETPSQARNTPEIFEGFQQLKKQGKARFLGFSAHSNPAAILSAALDTNQFDFAMVAYNFMNHSWLDRVIERAKKADVGVLAMKASRFLQNPYNRRQTNPARVKALDAAVPGNMTIFQKGFHWVLQNPNVSGVVIGISDMAQAKENIPLAMTKS
ncbi:MAG: aldo/keto reductase [Acidobacteria bacterium]|nr:aldo/keto reductase [Acidobacteriota bacterium]